MTSRSTKFFLFLSIFSIPFLVKAEIFCLPDATSTLVGKEISWSISGIGQEIPYFISWSSDDGVAVTPEDSLIYINKYEIIGQKSVRVLFGLEGIEPTYDIVCNPLIVKESIIEEKESDIDSTSTITIKRRRHTAQILPDVVTYGEPIILSASTSVSNISTSTKIADSNESMKDILLEGKFIFLNKLWIGLENEEVRELQLKLKDLGFLKVDPTGFFGLATQKAVIDFQKKNNIEPALGFVGPITRKILNKF